MAVSRYWADLSNNNTQSVDFDTYRRRGGHVLIGLKASEGLHFTDHLQPARAEAAHKARVHVAHYHFARPESPANEQADLFWKVAKAHRGRHDYYVLDIEERDGVAWPEVDRFVKNFAHRFRAISGHQITGYSGESFLTSMGPGGQIPSGRWWIAKYSAKPPEVPWIPRPWAWQRTDGSIGPKPHRCVGIGDYSDINVLNRASTVWLATHKP